MISRCPRPRRAGTAVPVAAALVFAAASASAQFEPANGMRSTDIRTHAIVDATVIPAPGQRLEHATIVMRDGVIVSVGTAVEIPPETRRWSGEGLTVYAGLIDAALLIDASALPEDATTRHPNPKVHPEVRMSAQTPPSASVRKSLRELGFTAGAVYPAGGIFRGQGTVIALAADDEHVLTYADPVAQAVAFERSGWGQATKPSSLMGSIAVIRQTLLDARWHAAANAVYATHPEGNEPPIPAAALTALAEVTRGGQPVLFDVGSELDALRAWRIAEEFGLQPWLLGSGLEFRRLREIVELGVPMIIPLSFPDRPDVSRLPESDAVTLRTLQTWEQAPTNPRRLIAAGATVALTTHRLEKRSEFPERMREAMKHGLDADAALTALTVTPARLLGLDKVMGTIEPGKLANLVVVDGELFAKKAKVRDTWINGRRHEITPAPDPVRSFAGTLRTDDGREIAVNLDTGKPTLHVGAGEAKVKAKKISVLKDRVTAVIDGAPFGVEGYVRIAGAVSAGEVTGTLALPDGARVPFSIRAEMPVATVALEDDDTTAAAADAIGRWEGELETDEASRSFQLDLERDEAGAITGRFESGTLVGVVATLETDAATGVITIAVDSDDEIVLEISRGDAGLTGEARIGRDAYTLTGQRVSETPARAARNDDDDFQMPAELLPIPLGAYGRTGTPEPETLLVRGATIWTAGPRGVIAEGDLLIEGGRIAAVGSVPSPPAGARVIDARGKHVTPGLLDCHSHTGINGGVNEYPEANTAEVRIGDVINPDDINWYRQLAGGLTAANQLHGSANPIGGQNSVVKLKWGGTVDDLRFAEAKGGIKFALGENVKRRSGRYPDTRMGVESFIRDAFVAAREYEEAHRRYRLMPTEEREKTMPPRRDLELDALVEIMNGDRLVHCHSYRQDEILMLIR
ncbi:MAG: amidohydrolase family protein, partial [Phycisphaerae bacterium]|nr:amidohydrolase family protein [Phycisphaerae bacterium]